jgi:CBS domain-containing protein
MKVQQLMTTPAHTCGPLDSLERAAQLLWEHDCGVLPVVDAEGRVDAVITDRDICMGAYTRGKRLADMKVADSMTRKVVSCRPDDDVGEVAQRMATHAVRRLPVVDGDGRIRGILSLNDLARTGTRDKDTARAAERVLAAVSQSRPAAARAAQTATRAPDSPAERQQARAATLLSTNVDREC